jgi:NTP pyrophosphatase (non-canonical NTP hydrolase)
MTICYGLLVNGHISDTSWTKEGLTKAIQERTGDTWALDEISHLIIEIEVPSIIEVVQWYFDKRELLYAQTPVKAFLFLVSEIGEIADAMVHGMDNWVRNNEREREVGPELGDALMMLCVTAERHNVDPLDEMLKKFAKKGYAVHE